MLKLYINSEVDIDKFCDGWEKLDNGCYKLTDSFGEEFIIINPLTREIFNEGYTGFISELIDTNVVTVATPVEQGISNTIIIPTRDYNTIKFPQTIDDITFYSKDDFLEWVYANREIKNKLLSVMLGYKSRYYLKKGIRLDYINQIKVELERKCDEVEVYYIYGGFNETFSYNTRTREIVFNNSPSFTLIFFALKGYITTDEDIANGRYLKFPFSAELIDLENRIVTFQNIEEVKEFLSNSLDLNDQEQ